MGTKVNLLPFILQWSWLIPFFAAHERGAAPEQIAYLPFSQLRPRERGGYRCVPAKFISGHAVPRESFDGFFGEVGLANIDKSTWDSPGS